MMDWEGNMVERQHRTQILLSEIEEDDKMKVSAVISSIETRTIDHVLDDFNILEEQVAPCYQPIPHAADEISSVLASILPLLDDMALYERLSARSEMGKFKASIGSTDAPSKEYTVGDNDTVATGPSTDDSSCDKLDDDDDDDDTRLLDQIYD